MMFDAGYWIPDAGCSISFFYGVDMGDFKMKNMSGGKRKSAVNQRGFTLMEILVAVMILAISIVVILQLFSGGLKSSRLSGDYTRAIFHAREKMEEILLQDEMTDEVLEGEFDDGYKWSVDVQYIEPDEEDKRSPIVDSFNIDVNINWFYGNKKKHFKISTIKIAKKIEEKS
jgi:general secretion pathway protein I